MSMIDRYNEHPARALQSVLPHMRRIGAGLSGILGNDAHTYGYHLSKARLLGTGKRNDKSLFGTANVPCVDDQAGCAIDIGMDWQASGEWLEWVRAERRAGRLAQITQLIGDPDKLPGAPRDIRDAAYADAGTNWLWVNYTGQGHVTWCHVGIGRRHANDEAFGNQLLGGWTSTGRIEEDEDLMADNDRIKLPQPNATGRPDIARIDLWRVGYLNTEVIKAQLAASETREKATLTLLEKALGGEPGSVDMAQIKAWIEAEGEKSRAAQAERDARVADALDPSE